MATIEQTKEIKFPQQQKYYEQNKEAVKTKNLNRYYKKQGVPPEFVDDFRKHRKVLLQLNRISPEAIHYFMNLGK